MEKRKLYLSQSDKKIAGVCGGIAEYLDTDATVIRLLWALAACASLGLGLLAYIAAALIIPRDPAV